MVDKVDKFFIVAIFLLISVGLVIAGTVRLDEKTDGSVETTLTEDISSIINITINNSEYHESANVTVINVTLPSSFTFTVGTDGVDSNITNNSFTSSGNVLTWQNLSLNGTGLIANNTNNSALWFNVTPGNPGIYNITVEVYNMTARMFEQNITVNVEQPAGIQITFGNGRLNMSLNASFDTHFVVNVSINNTFTATDKNITSVNITITEGLSFVAGTDQVGQVFSGNVTNATFANQGNIMTWTNFSGDLYLINSSQNVSTFAFNVSIGSNGITPGNFNITVEVYNRTGRMNERNLSVSVEDLSRPEISISNVSSDLTNKGNYSGILILNVSVHDYGIINTVLFNITNVSGGAANGTVFAHNYTRNQWNATINTAEWTDGVYNITVYVNDSSNNKNETNTTNFVVTFDNTLPIVLANNFSSDTVNRGNYSGNLILNISPADAGSGIDYIFFNITNSSGVQNATYAPSKQGTSWNTTINTNHFPDGTYNITAYVNDSAGNLNSSAFIFDVVFDNTNPTASYSCSPSTVNVGDTTTCTCSVSDATTAVNYSSYTTTPATTDTGTHTLTCSYEDQAGNSASTTTTYTVELSSSGSSSGGGGGSTTVAFYTKDIPVVAKEFKEVQTITQKLKEKERVQIKIENNIHFVGIRKISLTSATVEIASDPIQIELDVGEDAKVDVTGDGFYDVYVKLNEIVNGQADLIIKYLHEEIPKEKETGEAGGSVETTGEIVPPEAEKSLTWLWIIIGIIVLAIIIGGGIAVKKRK